MDRTYFDQLMTHCCVRSQAAKFESVGGEKFFATAYCILDGNTYDERCSLFIDKFSRATSTNWISIKRIDTSVRYEFRKTYFCQLSKRNKKTYGRTYVNKIRERDCMARVDFKWKHINKWTIRNDPNLDTGLNCMVNISFDHSHSLTSVETLAFLRPAHDTVESFKSYFKLGLTHTDAKNYHEIRIIDDLVNEKLVPWQLSNTQINPTIRQVIYMYNTWAANKETDDEFSYENLKIFAETLAEQGTQMAIDKDTLTLAIVTPLMERVFKEFSSREEPLTVWIENTEPAKNSLKSNKRIFATLFFVSSKIGALPIGCAFHKLETTQIAFTLLKDTIEKCANRPFTPSVIISGDDIVQRIPQQLVFKGAINILSASKTCQSLCTWLGLSKLNVDKELKLTVLRRFMKIVFAQSIESATEEHRSLCSSLKETPKIAKHVEFLWFRRNEWCLPFRNHLPMAAIDSVNCETSIRILKDTLLRMCRTFNPYALINVICNSLEKYNIDRLTRACTAKANDISLHYSKYIKPVASGIKVVKVAENDHQFQMMTGKVSCTVYSDLALCDCVTGRTGRFCEHLGFLSQDLSFWLNTPEILPEDIASFDQLTVGLKYKCESPPPSTSQEAEALDMEDFKTEEIEINDVCMTPEPFTSDEDDEFPDDCPFSTNDLSKVMTNSLSDILKKKKKTLNITIITEDINQKKIDTNDTCMPYKPDTTSDKDTPTNSIPSIDELSALATPESQSKEEKPPEAIEEILLIDQIKEEEIHINDVCTSPTPCSSDEEDTSANDIPFTDDQATITAPSETQSIEVTPKVPEEGLATDSFQLQKMDINDTFMTPIAHFFEDATEPQEDLFFNKELNGAEVEDKEKIDQDPKEDDPLSQPREDRPVNSSTTSGYYCYAGGKITYKAPVIDNIKEKFNEIGDLLSERTSKPFLMTAKALHDFHDVLMEIKTPEQAQVFSQEITRLKKLKRLGFKLPTLTEQKNKATQKKSKTWRTY